MFFNFKGGKIRFFGVSNSRLGSNRGHFVANSVNVVAKKRDFVVEKQRLEAFYPLPTFVFTEGGLLSKKFSKRFFVGFPNRYIIFSNQNSFISDAFNSGN